MKTLETIAGNAYVITSRNGGTVTDSTGTLSKPVEAGDQLIVTAPSDRLLIDDDEALMRPANFKRARLALRMLGAGKKEELPAGYTRLDFLQAVQGGKNNPLSYIKVPTNVNSFEDDFEFATCHELPTEALSAGAQYQEGVNESDWSIQWIWMNSNWRMYTSEEAYDTGLTNLGPVVLRCKRKRATNTMVATVGHMMRELPMSFRCLNYAFNVNPMGVFWTANNPKPNDGVSNNSYVALGKKWWWKFYINGKLQNDLRPALDASGTPCMYDLVNSTPFYNAGRVPFVAGVETVQQLRRVLDNLQPTGGTLTLSLPAEANTPEVAEQLQLCHDTKGWTLTVYEYRPAAAVTYSLRRVRQAVWCRMAENTDGSYVSDGGERFEIDRCAAIYGPLGSDPAAYGYEPFDSVEDAAAWFGLTPYEYPEELLTEA